MNRALRVIVIGLVLTVSIGVAAQDGLDAEPFDALLAETVGDAEPGVVLYVAIEGESYIGAAGLANLEAGTPITPDDLFRIGSVTKPFVSTLILQLVEEGEIELDAPIADYLPDDIAANIPNADTATVTQMLQMTSGIPSYTDTDAFDDATMDNPSYPWTAEETVATVYGMEPDFAPGSSYYYSNTNYNLAQIIIEQITGQSLAEAMHERIFAPLGMENSFVEMPDRFADGIVRGYTQYEDGEFEDITQINDGVGLGDGGIVSTADELAQFPVGLWYGDLISEETLELMLDTVDDGDEGMYGLGIGFDETDFGMMLSHDGSTSGFQSVMSYLPEDDIVVVILTNNFDSEIVQDLMFSAFDLAFEM